VADITQSSPYRLPLLLLVGLVVALTGSCSDDAPVHPHGPIAADVSAPLGEPLPIATAQQLAEFEAGREVAQRRFGLTDGLGPAFNVTFCSACHERPVTGGSAGLYRNFFIAGTTLGDGSFIPAESAGETGGVVRVYAFDPFGPDRPYVAPDVDLATQRNPIPFFGSGLLLAVDVNEIMSRADPDDADGDGISGRPNYENGSVGRFGRKAQTASIEGFIRGPLFNHLGITTEPLSEEQRAALPFADTVATPETSALSGLRSARQIVSGEGATLDFDGVPDPELASDDLFDLVSYSMLLAAPELEVPSEAGLRGAATFDQIGCDDCHTPRLESRYGPLPVYSDLLLHDMGPELADGVEMGSSSGSEFRTQPLWGLAAVGPYLHDGRATTITEAILHHGGEAEPARDRAAALEPESLAELVEFLESLGGRSQYTPGLLPPGLPVPDPGEFGAPVSGLDAEGEERFEEGRAAFDRDFGFADGVGAPRFNGDSCRACHFDPVIGGSGPAGVNVMRHGSLDDSGGFVIPPGGTILHKATAELDRIVVAPDGTTVFEQRQTPALFGLGLVEGIADSAITANADPDDRDGDGISGRAPRLEDGRLGRFGWKAQVPTLDEFVRDAASAELGMTLPDEPDATFGFTVDADTAADPELGADDLAAIRFFLANLGPPPPGPGADTAAATAGAAVFDRIGCALCHTPELPGDSGPVPLYSDLLLHDMGIPGVPEGAADPSEFRTPPLWGLRASGPYLHDGSADTIEAAISSHRGEAAASATAFLALTPDEVADLILFLGSL
jgi:CxxC motif-containing protein (DUF1111 family)